MTSPWIEKVGIHIDRAADVPVGIQLAWSLRRAITSGALIPGDRFPPLRELAEEVGVNPNTLRSVYARLEAEGLIETRHGSGTYVTAAGDGDELNRLVAGATRAAREAGVDRRALAAALYVERGTEGGDDQRHHRRQIQREIALLEGLLSRMPPPSRKVPTRRGPESRLLTLEDLERVRDDLIAHLGEAARSQEPADPAPEPAPASAPKRAAPRRKPKLGPATA